jgi:preprotein translocase subunit SecE
MFEVTGTFVPSWWWRLRFISTRVETMSKKKSRPNRIVKWWRDTWAEIRRVIWPTRKELINLTLVVLTLSVTMALMMWAFDQLFTWLYSVLSQVV